jgi:flagellar basal-body rod protein FlgG
MYTSASGMVPGVKKQDLIANNLSNVGTTGFKKDRMFTRELSVAEKKLTPKKSDWEQPMADRLFIDFAPGTFDKTGNPHDLAIEGDGFFTLTDPEGNTYLTRSGAFEVNQEGYLSYPGGYLLNGQGGPIQVGNSEFTVNQNGEVEIGGSITDRILPVTVPDVEKLDRIGGAMFSLPAGIETSPVPLAQIQQGYLEASNVDVVHEMVDMIITYRTYEANARALQQQDASLDNLFQGVAGDK